MLTAEQKNSRMTEERAVLTKLLEAALAGNFEEVKNQVEKYLRENIDMSVSDVLQQFKDGQKRTALHFACQSTPEKIDETGETDIVSQMITSDWIPQDELQKMIRLKDHEGLTPIMLAAMHESPKLAKSRVLALLKVGAVSSSSDKKLNKLSLARSKAGATALHYAAGAGGTAETIRALYESGPVALNTFSLKGGTPLHWAATGSPGVDRSETLSELLKCGADTNANVSAKEAQFTPPPLVIAAAAGNDTNSKYLINAAKEMDKDISPSLDFVLPGNFTLLHIVADMNLVGTLSLLLEREGMDQYRIKKNDEGFTPLELAARAGHVGCVLLLLPEENPTEEDAKNFIEEFQANLPEDKKADGEDEKNEKPQGKEGAAEDPTEVEAGKKTADILAEAKEISEEDKAKALEFKAEGNQHYSKKEAEKAIELYSKAIELYPTEPTFYSNRSACYLMLNKPKDALFDAVMARSLKPKWPKACYRMAVARLALERYEDAALSAWEGLQEDQENDELKSLLQKCVKKGRQVYHQNKS